MKGQQDIIAPVLMVGIFISIVASVYMWGIPLIEKNKGLVYLEKAEGMMRDLADKVKTVATSGGKETFVFDLPGKIVFSELRPDEGNFAVFMDVKGTKYATNFNYYFTQNQVGLTKRTIGNVDPVLAYVYVENVGGKYLHAYYLSTTPIETGDGCSFIALKGEKAAGGQGSVFELRYSGTKTVNLEGNLADEYPYCSGKSTTIRIVEVVKK